MSDVPRLPTRVGRAGWGDNRFRGHSVGDQLAGSTDLWSLIALAVGHRRLSPLEHAVLDDLAACGCAADPRIWPLKAVRLASAWGHAAPGLCAGLLATNGAHGPGSVRACAESLLEIAGELGDGDDTRLAEIVATRLADPERRFHGFGVAAREVDERSITFARCLERRGIAIGAVWALFVRIETVTRRLRGLSANFGGTMAAILLDLGLTPTQLPSFVLTVLYPSLVANAHEGAEQAPAVLRELPRASIRYLGTPPRTSPRAAATPRDDEPV
jgi:hypothetical protein